RYSTRPEARDLRSRSAATLRLDLPIRRRDLDDLLRHDRAGVDPALPLFPRLARLAPADDLGRARRGVGTRVHPLDRLLARSADADRAVLHHRAGREPLGADAR